MFWTREYTAHRPWGRQVFLSARAQGKHARRHFRVGSRHDRATTAGNSRELRNRGGLLSTARRTSGGISPVRDEALAPAGEHEDGACRGAAALMAAATARPSTCGMPRSVMTTGNGVPALQRIQESFDTGSAAVRGRVPGGRRVTSTSRSEVSSSGSSSMSRILRVRRHASAEAHDGRLGRRRRLSGKVRRNVVPCARRADDVDVRAVTLGDAVHHRQAQTRAAISLGGEERLEAAAARGFVHADAGVARLR